MHGKPFLKFPKTNTINSGNRCIVIIEWDNILFPNVLINDVSNRKHQTLSMAKQEYQQLYQISLHAYKVLFNFINKYSPENIVIIATTPIKSIIESLSKYKNIGYFNHIYTLLFKIYRIKFMHPDTSIFPLKSRQDRIKFKEIAFAKICCDPFFNVDNANSIACLGDDLCNIDIKQLVAVLSKDIPLIHKVKLKRNLCLDEIMRQIKFLELFYNGSAFDDFPFEIDIDYALFKIMKEYAHASMNKSSNKSSNLHKIKDDNPSSNIARINLIYQQLCK